MHAEAFAWVGQWASGEPIAVLDLGGRNINGSCRDLFPNADYTALDIVAGDGVDIVADAATWVPDREYDLVVCTEVFEHTPHWPQIAATAFKACRAGGRFLATMAGPGRPPHSAVDGGPLRPGEHYANVNPAELLEALEAADWVGVVVDEQVTSKDLRAVAHKPRIQL